MQIALNDKGDRILAKHAIKTEKYSCPCCEEEVIFCKGAIKEPYFSHKANSVCSIDENDMCEWHIRMQSYFSEQYREVVFKHNGQIHRADICKDGYIIEFQHSHISLDDFNKRNNFYKSLGYKIIWIFDTSDWFESGRIVGLTLDSNSKFKVSRPLSLWSYIPNDPDISICFCEAFEEYDGIDDGVYNIYWHNENWSRVMFDCGYGLIELSDDTDLSDLFKSPQQRRDEIFSGKSYTKIYRGIKGHRYQEYLCKYTNTWADCDNCRNCLVIEQKEVGSISYCNNSGTRDIDDDYYAYTVGT